jgi:hypothetical protein
VTRYQRQLHHQARQYRATTARWRLYTHHQEQEHDMSSNIDPANPNNGGTGLPSEGDLDQAREEVARRHTERRDRIRRENPPSTPVAPGGNK